MEVTVFLNIFNFPTASRAIVGYYRILLRLGASVGAFLFTDAWKVPSPQKLITGRVEGQINALMFSLENLHKVPL